MASSVNGQHEPNLMPWLATQAGKTELTCWLGTSGMCCKKNFSESHINNKSLIDQDVSVKMPGFIFCKFMELNDSDESGSG